MIDVYLHARFVRDLKELVESIDKIGAERFNSLTTMILERPKAFEPTKVEGAT